MKEIVLAALYWFANLLLLAWAAAMAVNLWQKPNRVWKAVGLIAAGITWHAARGLYEYRSGSCSGPAANESFLVLANRCIPGTDIDILYAQAAIFVGLYVLIAERFREKEGSR